MWCRHGQVRPTGLPRILAVLLASLFMGSAAKQISSICDAATFLGPNHPKVPCLAVPTCDQGKATVGQLQLWSGKRAFSAETTIDVCHRNFSALNVSFHAKGDTLLRNDYTECNTETWNQEVMEIFLAAGQEGGADPSEYYEFEITPKGTLYAAMIHNPFHNGTNKTNAMVSCDAFARAGGRWGARNSSEQHTWDATIGIPLPPFERPRFLRANFFRVLMHQSVAICDAGSCEYGAWSPTYTPAPQYHVSTYLGVLALE